MSLNVPVAESIESGKQFATIFVKSLACSVTFERVAVGVLVTGAWTATRGQYEGGSFWKVEEGTKLHGFARNRAEIAEYIAKKTLRIDAALSF